MCTAQARTATADALVESPHVFFFQAEDGIRDYKVTGVQTCALPIYRAQPARAGIEGVGAVGRGHRADGRAQVGLDKHVRIVPPEVLEDPGGPGAVELRSEERRVGKGWRAWGSARQ